MNPSLYDESYFKEIRGAKSGDDLYTGFLGLIEDLPAAISVLDLGCGRGEMVARLAQREETSVYGLDFSSAAVEATRAKLSPELSSQIIHGSATDESVFPAETFDVIFLMDVVEHLPPQALLDTLVNVRRWLKPKGRVVIHTFPTLGLHCLYRSFLKLARKQGELERLDAIHCNVQTRESLRCALEDSGLLPDKIWLSNDFTRTSTSYQRLPEGLPKKILAFFLDRVLGHPLARRFFETFKLAEFASPSIYCFASK